MDGFTNQAIRAASRAPRVAQRPTSVPIHLVAPLDAADVAVPDATTTRATAGSPGAWLATAPGVASVRDPMLPTPPDHAVVAHLLASPADLPTDVERALAAAAGR